MEYPREIWRLHRLPGLTRSPGKRPHARMHLRFDRLAQPWLRTLAKRWARLRLCSGLNVGTVQNDLLGLTRFSAFLAEAAPDVHALADIDRALLERYLAWVANQPIGRGAKEDAVTAPGMFFQAIRQHDWDDRLPTTAVFFPDDLPARPARLARRVAEHIMAQIEAPANLDRWPDPQGRLITMILIRCGLRVTDACTLPFDCLLHDGRNAAYLRYFNNKMRREAAVPIDEELETEIRTQQHLVCGPLARPASTCSPPSPHRRRTNSMTSQLPRHAAPLAQRLRHPRRTRPACPPHPAPMAAYLRLQADQP